MLLAQIFYQPTQLLKAPPAGPPGIPPRWGGRLLAWMGYIFDRWSAKQSVRLLAWVAIVWLTYRAAFPMLYWPFKDQEGALQAVVAYASATILLPLGIGLLTGTGDDPFWRAQKYVTELNLRFYTHLGASVGYHVGYMMIFAAALLGHYLGVAVRPVWINCLAAAWPVILGAAAAQQIPFNQWRAFGRVWLADGAIFAIFFLFGPLLAGFFFEYHSWLINPLTGIPLITLGLICVAVLSRWPRPKE